MKLTAIISQLSALFIITQQAPSGEKCICDVSLKEKAFPYDKLQTVEGNTTNCNGQITPGKALQLESLLLGLEKRVIQLNKDMAVLEKEDDGELYGVLSLQIIENEMVEIQQMMDKLNSTTLGHQILIDDSLHQLEGLKEEMQELEKFDTMEVVKGRLDNKRLHAALGLCRRGNNTPIPLTQAPYGTCQRGPLRNITEPRVSTRGEFEGSYSYGAWGQDPKPEAGKESWYWLVVMTSNNRFSNYVRFYSSLSALIIGVSGPGNVQIHPSNPTTNTIQGPNNVLYGGALYYNCYNQDTVCRFNVTTKTITTVKLPDGIRYNSKGNYCHLDDCYPFTDLDLATDESGVWVIYTTTQDFGNLVLTKVEEGAPPMLGQTWRTSLHKRSASNTFMACGVLYATRYVDKRVEEIFYSFDTTTGKENFKVGIFMKKLATNIQALNYSPVDQMLHAYCDSYMVSYKALFG